MQTRNVFEGIRRVLAEAGAEMKDIVKFNTFYVFEGEGDEIREYWEKMTRVRMEFFEEPGPCGTGVRVSGLAYPDLLIEVEAIAYRPAGDGPMTFAVLGRDARTGQIGGALATASIDAGRVSPWTRGLLPT